jgi:hypothetical protein
MGGEDGFEHTACSERFLRINDLIPLRKCFLSLPALPASASARRRPITIGLADGIAKQG